MISNNNKYIYSLFRSGDSILGLHLDSFYATNAMDYILQRIIFHYLLSTFYIVQCLSRFYLSIKDIRAEWKQMCVNG